MPLASDSWQKGDPYERYIGRWSRKVAPIFLAWLNVSKGRRWLDVGCGTGALIETVLHHGSPSRALGVEPSSGFLEEVWGRLGSKADLLRGSASDLPLRSSSVDAVVSALVLNFVPEPERAVEEMSRVAGPGGLVGTYVWDYSGRMDMLRAFWDAAVEIDAGARAHDEGVRFPLCRPEALQTLFEHAGLLDVSVRFIDVETRFERFQDLWEPFLGGQGPAPTYLVSLNESKRQRLRAQMESSLPQEFDGSMMLNARAWAVKGHVSS